jgi:hypothetical protein
MGVQPCCCAAVWALLLLVGCAVPAHAIGGDVTGVWPPAGGTAGGTPVVLFGETYFDVDDVTCVFGAAAVPAAVASPWVADCTSPPGAAGFASVHLSLNGGVDVGDEVMTEFLYTGALVCGRASCAAWQRSHLP